MPTKKARQSRSRPKNRGRSWFATSRVKSRIGPTCKNGLPAAARSRRGSSPNRKCRRRHEARRARPGREPGRVRGRRGRQPAVALRRLARAVVRFQLCRLCHLCAGGDFARRAARRGIPARDQPRELPMNIIVALLIILLVAVIALYIVRQLPLDQAIKNVALLVVGIICLIAVLIQVLPLVGVAVPISVN